MPSKQADNRRDPSRGLESGRPTQAGFLDISAIAPRINGPRGGDRGFIAGRSGSGKTFLARHLLPVYGASAASEFKGLLLIVDPNHNFEYPSNRIVASPVDALPTKKEPVVIYRPGPEVREAEDWNLMWRNALLTKDHIMVYVDEAYAMEPLFGARRIEGGNMLNAYLTQGRAKGKAALLSAQRPVNIPRNIIAQAEWFYMFDLPLEDDRRTVAGVIGRETDQGEDILDRDILDRFEFVFSGPDLRRPMRMRIRE